jgi:DNA-binding response OmpR family regulator
MVGWKFLGGTTHLSYYSPRTSRHSQLIPGRRSLKVLVIDDDRILADYIRLAMGEDGHAVDVSHTGEEGQSLALIHDYDAIILDHILPRSTGMDVLRNLRERGCSTPIVMLTARNATNDLVEGLDAGADDYLVKPFEIAELRARVRALARRGKVQPGMASSFADLVVDRLTHRVLCNGKTLSLTPKEYAFIGYMIAKAGQIVTRTELLEKVWDIQFDPGSNVVDVHVARLRSKLQAAGSSASISTRRGSGFIMDLVN